MQLGEFVKLLADLWFAAGDLSSVPDIRIPAELVADVERIIAECRKLQTCERSGQYYLLDGYLKPLGASKSK